MTECLLDRIGADRYYFLGDFIRRFTSVANTCTIDTSNIHQLAFDQVSDHRLGRVDDRNRMVKMFHDVLGVRVRGHHFFAEAPFLPTLRFSGTGEPRVWPFVLAVGLTGVLLFGGAVESGPLTG